MSLHIIRAITENDVRTAMNIRKEVFIHEQNVPAAREQDGCDTTAWHYLALDAGIGVGTARVRLLDAGEKAKIERMAIKEACRGKGVGTCLLRYILQDLCQQGIRTAILSAQGHATGFYSRFGFAPVGEGFIDANMLHYTMQCTLDDHEKKKEYMAEKNA